MPIFEAGGRRPDPACALYRALPGGWEKRLAAAVEEGAVPGRPVFFRADDAAAPGAAFSALVELFRRRRAPIAFAVVPAWLTRPRWEALSALCPAGEGLWSFHQHGFRHVNHEAAGKKCEFGESRDPAASARDIAAGRERLAKLTRGRASSIFTPPWNRMSGPALAALADQGFAAVSRSLGARPPAPAGLRDLYVSVDLHTRKENDPDESLEALLSELSRALSGGPFCGVMIHHRRMNEAAFVFLDRLLGLLAAGPGLSPLSMEEAACYP